ncbi:SDR family oxidoreductase [Microbacterium sp. B2969]|uniref:SDR family oxidoreductase n=1 Tax=Microbacterium alkaliflavum TaxID=3248839 RepID=A0ABW7QBI4_9MICO
MSDEQTDPREKHQDRFPPQSQGDQPGKSDEVRPKPDAGEDSYRGSGRLEGRKALITGGDSGIGRAVAIAFAREGADVAIAHMAEELEDADEVVRLIADAGRRGVSFAGDLREERFATSIVTDTIAQFGGLDILVLNAAYQKDRDGLATLETDEFDRVFRTNLYGLLWSARAAAPHLEPGSSIIVTASIQAFHPSPSLVDYAMTKAAQVAFVKAMAQEFGPKGVRVNAVAPGPVWTPLIPATGWDQKKVEEFGTDTPLGRAAQPAELAGAYVYLASEEASYVSAAVLPVTGGKEL